MSGVTVARMWRGWTTPANAKAYEAFLFDTLLPQVKALDGYVSAEVLHRMDGDQIAWVSILKFASMEHIRQFAGDTPEAAVLEPEALALLSRYDTHVTHFECRAL